MRAHRDPAGDAGRRRRAELVSSAAVEIAADFQVSRKGFGNNDSGNPVGTRLAGGSARQNAAVAQKKQRPVRTLAVALLRSCAGGAA